MMAILLDGFSRYIYILDVIIKISFCIMALMLPGLGEQSSF